MSVVPPTFAELVTEADAIVRARVVSVQPFSVPTPQGEILRTRVTFEVEATLVQHPAILEAAVIGKEDSDGLTKTKAFIVLKSGQRLSEDEVKAFVKERLAPYKYPRFIEFVAELPKTATGKIQRFRLRDLEQQRG